MIKYLLFFLLIPTFCFAGVDFAGQESDYITIADHNDLDGDPMSASIWVKVEAVQSKTFPRFIDKRFNDGYVLVLNAGTLQPAFYWGDGGASDNVIDDDVVTAGVWTHLGIKHDGSNASLYVKGIKDPNSKATARRIGDNADNLTLGDNQSSSPGNEYFTGYVNEFAYWNIDLTDAEFAQLANAKVKGMPLQIRPANLKVYLPLDDLPDGSNINTQTFINRANPGTHDGTGTDADGDSPMKAEEILSYP